VSYNNQFMRLFYAFACSAPRLPARGSIRIGNSVARSM